MPEHGSIRILSDARQPDWRFSILTDERVLGEAYFDADHGWRESDRPRGWTLRYEPAGPWEDHGLEVALAPGGRELSWAAREAAIEEALRLISLRIADGRIAA